MPHRRDNGSGPAKRARHVYYSSGSGLQPYCLNHNFNHNPIGHRPQQHHSSARLQNQKARQTHVAKPPIQRQYHYYDNGTWQHPSSVRESRYSDFVPCTYDEQTILTRLYKYALTFLSHANATKLSPRTLFGGSRAELDTALEIEMITSSPSPTLHSTSPSPRTGFSRPSNGSYRYPAATSPRAYIKPPSPAAFPKQLPPIPKAPHKRSLSVSTKSSDSSSKQLVDAATQCSPVVAPSSSGSEASKSRGKRKERSKSPDTVAPPSTTVPPPEPEVAPQMPIKRSTPPPPSTNSLVITSSTPSTSTSSQGSSPKRARAPKPAAKIMPAAYETCDVKDLVLLISNMLMELIRFNDAIPLKDGRLTRFHSRAPPGISVLDYLQRLTMHATLSPPILLSMVYYIDRLCALYPAFTISSLTVHRFLITSATVASKGLSDSFWTNNTYARVGGVSLKELALLELEFLWRVEWRIVPKPEVLVDYYRSLVERSEGFEVEGPVWDRMSGVEGRGRGGREWGVGKGDEGGGG